MRISSVTNSSTQYFIGYWLMVCGCWGRKLFNSTRDKTNTNTKTHGNWNNTTDNGINEMTNLTSYTHSHSTKQNQREREKSQQDKTSQHKNAINNLQTTKEKETPVNHGRMNRGKLTKCLPVYLSFNYNIFGNIARRLSNYAWSSLFCLICDGYSCHMHANNSHTNQAQEKAHWEYETENNNNNNKIIDMITYSVRFFVCLLFARYELRAYQQPQQQNGQTQQQQQFMRTKSVCVCSYVYTEENCRGKLISFIRMEKVFENVCVCVLNWITHGLKERERENDI